MLNDLYRLEKQAQIAKAHTALEKNACGDMAGLPTFLDVEARNLYILERCEEPMPEGQIRLRLEKKLAGVQGIQAVLEFFANLKEGSEDKTSSYLMTRLK